MVWAHEGRNSETLAKFFTALGSERAAFVDPRQRRRGRVDPRHGRRQRAERGALPGPVPRHHVGDESVGQVRTRTLATQAGSRDRNLMWAVRKNPGDLATGQRTTLAELEAVNAELFRAYLLKEQLREVFRRKGAAGHALLSGWILWARRCGIAEFEKLCRTIERYRTLIGHTLDHNVPNARSEATNTHIRALTKRAYGYHSPEALIGMAMLTPTRPNLTHGNVRRSVVDSPPADLHGVAGIDLQHCCRAMLYQLVLSGIAIAIAIDDGDCGAGERDRGLGQRYPGRGPGGVRATRPHRRPVRLSAGSANEGPRGARARARGVAGPSPMADSRPVVMWEARSTTA